MKRWSVNLPGGRAFELESDTPREAMERMGHDAYALEEIVRPQRLTLTVPEAAAVLGVSTTKMYQVTKIRGFPAIRLGRRTLVSAKGLEAWVESMAEKGWYA